MSRCEFRTTHSSFLFQKISEQFEILKLGCGGLMQVVLCFARDYNLRVESSLQEFANDR